MNSIPTKERRKMHPNPLFFPTPLLISLPYSIHVTTQNHPFQLPFEPIHIQHLKLQWKVCTYSPHRTHHSRHPRTDHYDSNRLFSLAPFPLSELHIRKTLTIVRNAGWIRPITADLSDRCGGSYTNDSSIVDEYGRVLKSEMTEVVDVEVGGADVGDGEGIV